MKYGIINRAAATIYEYPAKVMKSDMGMISSIADEGLYGMVVAILGAAEHGFVPVKTFYGYTGYMELSELWIVTPEEAETWECSGLMVVDGFCIDIVSIPKVQGIRCISLYRGAIVAVESFESEVPGWAKVRLVEGQIGYMRNQYLRIKEFSQTGLWIKELPQKKNVDENCFRRAVVENARQYLGVQYRWGGKSTAGIDCSGLTSMSYMLQGVLIYRDAKIMEGYPIHEISRAEMLPGDLMYFPGHIAMYMGGGKYIHSTGKTGSGGVVINSLNPGAEDYRLDLDQKLYAVGSLFF